MLKLVFVFFGSMLPGVLYNVKRSNLLWVGLCGLLGWTAFEAVSRIYGTIIFAAFIGAMVVGIYSESMAIILKIPATVFSVSGIFPLVPGIAAYNTIQLIVNNKLANAANKGIETLSGAAAIAFGIMIISAIFRVIRKRIEKNKRAKV